MLPPLSKKGLTLLELVVVLVVLVALSGIVLSRLGGDGLRVRGPDGQERSGAELVTITNLQRLRDILVGTPDQPGYLQDVGALPENLEALITRPDGVPVFDRASRSGWNGPYLTASVRDAWGEWVVLQQGNTSNARLVSGGPNQEIDTLDDANGSNRVDDLLLFLLREDPL
ncbi:MAG: type II secretion system protein GspG [Verrucomicrobia bacterium]|nr:type II secretion system protein GspG [Verrucomicrobiota bacterium]MCH8527625.1 type II secretion system protein GspG [Kiritimatiellia bacterium]